MAKKINASDIFGENWTKISFTDGGILFSTSRDGQITERKVVELSGEINNDIYEELGSAFGMDMFHCLFIASRHCKNFHERLAAYTFIPGGYGCGLGVKFLELKQPN